MQAQSSPSDLDRRNINLEAGGIKTALCVLQHQNRLAFERRTIRILTPGLRMLLGKFAQLFF